MKIGLKKGKITYSFFMISREILYLRFRFPEKKTRRGEDCVGNFKSATGSLLDKTLMTFKVETRMHI